MATNNVRDGNVKDIKATLDSNTNLLETIFQTLHNVQALNMKIERKFSGVQSELDSLHTSMSELKAKVAEDQKPSDQEDPAVTCKCQVSSEGISAQLLDMNSAIDSLDKRVQKMAIDIFLAVKTSKPDITLQKVLANTIQIYKARHDSSCAVQDLKAFIIEKLLPTNQMMIKQELDSSFNAVQSPVEKQPEDMNCKDQRLSDKITSLQHLDKNASYEEDKVTNSKEADKSSSSNHNETVASYKDTVDSSQVVNNFASSKDKVDCFNGKDKITSSKNIDRVSSSKDADEAIIRHVDNVARSQNTENAKSSKNARKATSSRNADKATKSKHLDKAAKSKSPQNEAISKQDAENAASSKNEENTDNSKPVDNVASSKPVDNVSSSKPLDTVDRLKQCFRQRPIIGCNCPSYGQGYNCGIYQGNNNCSRRENAAIVKHVENNAKTYSDKKPNSADDFNTLVLRHAKLSDNGILRCQNFANSRSVFAQCMAAQPFTKDCSSFSVVIEGTGQTGEIGIGGCPYNFPYNQMPGWFPGSIGYHADDGGVFIGYSASPATIISDASRSGDVLAMTFDVNTRKLTFSRNKTLLYTMTWTHPAALYPVICMRSTGEAVRLLEMLPWRK